MKTLRYMMFLCLLGCPVCGEYEPITGYSPGRTLYAGQGIYMTGGGFDSLTLFDNSTAIIEGTGPLIPGSGGIWLLSMYDTSYLEFSGGAINHLNLNGNATAILSGGSLLEIESYQQARLWDKDNQVWRDNRHITIVCLEGREGCVYDPATGLLTGRWLDSTPFSIRFIDVEGFSPVIENITFIPEPGTLILIGLGGLCCGKVRAKHRDSEKFVKKA